jgi:hypothetical protein
MFRRVFLMLLPLAMSGCASRSGDDRPGILARAVQPILNRLLATDCRARDVPSGSTWIDKDLGSRKVEAGDNGYRHPVPEPPRESAEVVLPAPVAPPDTSKS